MTRIRSSHWLIKGSGLIGFAVCAGVCGWMLLGLLMGLQEVSLGEMAPMFALWGLTTLFVAGVPGAWVQHHWTRTGTFVVVDGWIEWHADLFGLQGRYPLEGATLRAETSLAQPPFKWLVLRLASGREFYLGLAAHHRSKARIRELRRLLFGEDQPG